ncbi:MAG: carbohydrate ABC transporter permease [Firmicutes bacterium]|nr:carbohydrate ABC transporter permease [Bacillota bacterium]
MNRHQRFWLKRIFTYVALSIITFGFIFPFLWMVSTSIKGPTEIFSPTPNWIPKKITFEHYRTIWTETPFPTYFKNSLFVSIATTAITLLIGTFLAYGISRFRFRGRKLIANTLVVTQMFPLVLMIIPIFLIFIRLALLNTHTALIISYCTFALPFATLMLKSYFDALPPDLEEAALIDGCTHISALFRIVLPLSAPGIAAVGLFAFILAWQEFLIALTLTRTTDMRTLPVGISMMIGFREILWGPLMAGSVIIALPVVILFTYFQKYLISGLTMGAVKS